MTTLKEKWKTFFSLVLDPWNLILIIATGSLFYISQINQDPVASSLLNILLTLAAAILGGRISQQWASITESGVLVARGKSAVRGLKLLLQSVSTLEARIKIFKTGNDADNPNPEVTQRNYEEAIAMCRVIQEEAVSSIENWTDIVPEADIKTLIGEMSSLKTKIEGREEELRELNSTLNDAHGKSANEKETLRSQILEKEKQIRILEKEVVKAKVSMGGIGGIIGASNTSGLGSVIVGSGEHPGLFHLPAYGPKIKQGDDE